MSNISTVTINEEVGITDTTAVDAFFNGTDSRIDFNETYKDVLVYLTSSGYAYWICNIVTVVLGLAGNALVMVLMSDVKFSKLSYAVYLKFLAISDSLVLLLFGIRESLRLFTSPYLVASSSIVCAITRFTLNTTTMASPWLVVGLTVDRFFCVVFPLKRHLLCTRKIAIITCSTISVFSVALSLPFLFRSNLHTEYNICGVHDDFLEYFTFLRLLINSNIPCVLILIFNIVIGIHIQRSALFRKKFINASSGSTKDNSLRPLLLISMLAFLTIMPSSIVDTVMSVFLIRKTNLNRLSNWWFVVNIPYLVNFGQNFYILMASSANYRKIMKTKLKSLSDSRRTENIGFSMSAIQLRGIEFA